MSGDGMARFHRRAIPAQQVKTDPPLAIIVLFFFFWPKKKTKTDTKKETKHRKKTHRVTSNKYSFAKRVPRRWPVSSLIYYIAPPVLLIFFFDIMAFSTF